MYATDRRQSDRQTDVRQKHRLMPPPYRGGGTNMGAQAMRRWPSNNNRKAMYSL